MLRLPFISRLFPYTTLFRSNFATFVFSILTLWLVRIPSPAKTGEVGVADKSLWREVAYGWRYITPRLGLMALLLDRKSTRLNSSHVSTSYAVFCLKKKQTHQ